MGIDLLQEEAAPLEAELEKQIQKAGRLEEEIRIIREKRVRAEERFDWEIESMEVEPEKHFALVERYAATSDEAKLWLKENLFRRAAEFERKLNEASNGSESSEE